MIFPIQMSHNGNFDYLCNRYIIVMNMKKLLLSVMSLLTISAGAQEISVEKARQYAFEFLNETAAENAHSQIKSVLRPQNNLELTYTASQDDAPLLYVFNNPNGGFVVASAQGVAEPVLAYSNEGSFDYSTVNPNFMYWLDFFQRQISEAMNAGFLSAPDSKEPFEKADVPVMLTTSWSQSSPYNSMTPSFRGRNCYAGCVATALAQIMKYHEWPETGIGSHSYFDGYGCEQAISSDFSAHTYDWANMRDTYSLNDTCQAEIDAVAQLMFDVGVAVEMEYTSNDGSGAFTEHVPYALVKFFGYDKGVRHIYHNCMSDSEWEQIIYSELAAGRPLLFGGGDDAAHSFVCDGYEASSDMYHFNFGWGNGTDGYCRLSAVHSGYYEFDAEQDIVCGIQPPVEASQPVHTLVIDLQSYLEAEAETTAEGFTTYDISFGYYYSFGSKYPGCLLNDSWDGFDALFTMKYTNQDTGEVFYAGNPEDAETNRYHFGGCYSFDYAPELDFVYDRMQVRDVIVPELPDGLYHITLAWKHYEDKDNDDESLWTEIPAHAPYTNYVELEIGETGIREISPLRQSQRQQVYNLNGQRMNSLRQGINIVDGVKVLRL